MNIFKGHECPNCLCDNSITWHEFMPKHKAQFSFSIKKNDYSIHIVECEKCNNLMIVAYCNGFKIKDFPISFGDV